MSHVIFVYEPAKTLQFFEAPGFVWAAACFTNTARSQLAFVAPRLAPGDHDLVLEWPGGSETLTAALRTVRRHRASEVYALRRLLPPARRLGARLLDDERLLIGSEELP